MMNRKEQLSTKTIWRPLGMGALWVAIPAILTALNVGGQQALWEVVHWTVATWGMVALGVWGWRQAEGVTRQVRGVLTLGLISYALGQLLWDVQWLVGEVQFPAFSDVFYLSVSLFFMAALVISAHGRLSLADELALYLDTSMIFTAQASMIAIFYVPRAASLDGAQTALLVAYPVIFLAAAGAGLVGALKAHARFMLASPYPLLGGLAFSGICWVIWNSMFLDGPILPGTWVGYGFSLAHLILGAGVAVWDLTPTEHLRSLIWARRMLRLLPVLAIPLAVVALMWGQTDHVLSQWLNLGGVGVIMLALLRQSLLFWERDSFFVRERAALRRAEQALTERQQAERARQALLDIMRGGITTTDLADFLSLVHRTINRVIYAENFFISLYDKTTGLFEEVYCVDQYDQPAGPHSLGKSVSAYVFRTGQPLLLSHAQFDQLLAQGEVELIGANSPSWLGVPLKTSIETIGVMVVQHYEKSDIYSEQDVEFLTSIAGQIALMVEKKRNEETLLQFRDLMDETEDAIFLIDLATSQYLDFNNTALTYLGYSREEMSQLGLIQVVQPSITLEEWRTQVKQVIEKNGMLWETEYCRKDGTLFPVEVSARIWGYGGRNVMIVIARDITERKLVEDALRASESNLLTAQAIAHLGNWVLDPVSGQGFWSPEMYHIFEYSSQAEPPRFDEFLHLVHPEDVPHLLTVNQEAAQTDATLSVEFRTNPARGPVKHILGLIHRRMQPDGTIILLGTVQDITERKQAMEALRESEDRFRSLIENLPIGVYRTTPGAQGRFLMANPAFVSMFDYEAEEYLQNITVADLYVNPEDRKNFSDHLIAQGSVTGVELHLKKRDGTPVWSSVTARVVHTEDGQVSHFDCTIEDITERKKAAEELKRRGDEFASLYEITRDLTIQWDLPRLLNMVVSQAAALLKTPGGGIYLYDPERGDLSVEVSLGAGFPTGVRLALGEGLAGRVAQSLQPLVIDDYQVWAGRAHYYNHIPIRAVLGVPMVYGGELIGVLLVEHFGEVTRPFTQTDVRLLSLMAAQAAGAVHNARLFEATRYRLAEMEAVSRVSTALRTTQALGEMLTLLLDETLGVLDTEAGSIVLYDAEKGGLYPAVARGWFAEIDQTPMSPEEGVAGHVFSTGKVYSVREFVSDPHPRASSRLHTPPGWGGVCLPIRTAQEIVGVLFVSVPLPRELIADEVRLLVTLCEIAGNALHRTRLHEQTQRSLRRLGALHAVDLAISSSFDLNVSLNVLLEQTLFHLEADAAVISRLNTSLYLLEFAAGRGLYTAMASKTRLQLGDAYAGQVALERRLISLPDLATAPPLKNSAFATVESIRAYHAVPLIAKGQVKGVLEVFHRKPFRPDQEWLNFLQTLGGQAAIAIDSAELFTGLQRSNMELRLAYEATIEGWSRALDLRDEETEGHTQRVTETTLRLARAMGLSGEELNHIRRGALLHDIGKMGVPDNILLKPGDLTPQEWAVMRRHPEYAYEMLAPIEYLHPALDIPYCHHEKWDGTGYPRGLKGDQIPLAARLFTIVDIWDALRSNRPYRKAWPEAHVRTYIREQSGKFFDPQVVETFLSMLAQDDQLETP